jgi:hypothetical protein
VTKCARHKTDAACVRWSWSAASAAQALPISFWGARNRLSQLSIVGFVVVEQLLKVHPLKLVQPPAHSVCKFPMDCRACMTPQFYPQKPRRCCVTGIDGVALCRTLKTTGGRGILFASTEGFCILKNRCLSMFYARFRQSLLDA